MRESNARAGDGGDHGCSGEPGQAEAEADRELVGPRARLAVPVAARRARLQGAPGWAAASWSMALMSASVVVLNGSMLWAARLRTSAPSNAEMVRSARAAARPGAMPSGSKRVTSAARHRAKKLLKSALNSSWRG